MTEPDDTPRLSAAEHYDRGATCARLANPQNNTELSLNAIADALLGLLRIEMEKR